MGLVVLREEESDVMSCNCQIVRAGRIEQDLDLETLYKTKPQRHKNPNGILQHTMEVGIHLLANTDQSEADKPAVGVTNLGTGRLTIYLGNWTIPAFDPRAA